MTDEEQLEYLQQENYDLEHALGLAEEEVAELEIVLSAMWLGGFKAISERAAANSHVFERILERYQETVAKSALDDEEVVTLTHDAAILGLYLVSHDPGDPRDDPYPNDNNPLD